MTPVITYQELDSIEAPTLYQEDDVVEIFIRANSGGTKLGKSELLFSLLTAAWDDADTQMEQLLENLNQHGFAFTRDFTLKTCLTLLDQGSAYNVEKFRRDGVRNTVEERWKDISDAVKAVLDFVRSKTFIQCDRALTSYNALIPLIYLRYHFPDAWRTAHGVDSYLLRSLLAGAFGGRPDQVIDSLVRQIKEDQAFDLEKAFGVIRDRGRSLELTEDRLWEMGYGSDTVHLLFNLWYRDFGWTPAYEQNYPEIDHIFPKSLLMTVKETNSDSKKKSMKYREADRNQLANCMLLTKEENCMGDKGDTPPDEWFANKPADYLEKHLIPTNPDLWKLDRFEEFIDERKKLIRQKFAHLLVPAKSSELA